MTNGRKMLASTDIGDNNIIYFFENKGRSYILMHREGVRDEDTIEEIVASFEFEKEISDDISTWRTFKHEKSNVQVKYPSNATVALRENESAKNVPLICDKDRERNDRDTSKYCNLSYLDIAIRHDLVTTVYISKDGQLQVANDVNFFSDAPDFQKNDMIGGCDYVVKKSIGENVFVIASHLDLPRGADRDTACKQRGNLYKSIIKQIGESIELASNEQEIISDVDTSHADTSDWTRCMVGAQEWLCPPGWLSYDRGIQNFPVGDEYGEDSIAISISGAPVDQEITEGNFSFHKENAINELKEWGGGNCMTLSNTELETNFKCVETLDDGKYLVRYNSVSRYDNNSSSTIGISMATLLVESSSKRTYEINEEVITRIVEEFSVSGTRFIIKH